MSPPVTVQKQLPFGPYPNVQNTGTFLADAGKDLRSTFCWDGDAPGIAVVDHDKLTAAKANLPNGVSDPDIVFGLGGQFGVVAYTINEEIRYQTFSYQNGQVNLDPPTFVAQGVHPNLDKQLECDENIPEEVVLVFQDLNQDIQYSEGFLNGNFSNSLGVPNPTGYTARIRPDVAFIGKQAPGTVVFTYVGESNGSYFVHTDRVRATQNQITIQNTQQSPVLPGLGNTHPRIDGVLNGDYGFSIDYFYQVVYHTENLIYEANNNQPFTLTYQQGTRNELPVVAYSGDFSDIIWVTDNLPGNNLELMGKEFFEGIPNPDLKALTANPNPGGGGGTGGCASSGDNIVPSIDGHCGGEDEYITFWYNENSQSLRFKFAKSEGANNYKRGSGNASGSKTPQLLPEFIQRGQFEMPDFQVDHTVQIFSLSGQLLRECHFSDFEMEIGSLKAGSYVLLIGSGADQQSQKLLLQ